MKIKRNEIRYKKEYKYHKMVCDKCESDLFSIEDLNVKHNMGIFIKPIIITCSNCGNEKSYSREDWFNLRQELVDEILIEIEEE